MKNKMVFVVPYTRGNGNTGYTLHYTERKAKVWGFRHMAKTGERFTVLPMPEAEAMRLR